MKVKTDKLRKNYCSIRFKGVMKKGSFEAKFFIDLELAGKIISFLAEAEGRSMNKKEFTEMLKKTKQLDN